MRRLVKVLRIQAQPLGNHFENLTPFHCRHTLERLCVALNHASYEAEAKCGVPGSRLRLLASLLKIVCSQKGIVLRLSRTRPDTQAKNQKRHSEQHWYHPVLRGEQATGLAETKELDVGDRKRRGASVVGPCRVRQGSKCDVPLIRTSGQTASRPASGPSPAGLRACFARIWTTPLPTF